MKDELLKGKFYDIKEVKEAVEKAVLFYKTARPHMSINKYDETSGGSHSYRRNKEMVDQL